MPQTRNAAKAASRKITKGYGKWEEGIGEDISGGLKAAIFLHVKKVVKPVVRSWVICDKMPIDCSNCVGNEALRYTSFAHTAQTS